MTIIPRIIPKTSVTPTIHCTIGCADRRVAGASQSTKINAGTTTPNGHAEAIRETIAATHAATDHVAEYSFLDRFKLPKITPLVGVIISPFV